ncbi:MAG TPA: universal stress protein [Anaerolineales bacterium]|nr:universal stress protein [Anaerolineales bacterium]
MKPELLITTNGYKDTWSAIEYGVWLADAMQLKVRLLGVAESLRPAVIDDHHPLEDVFAKAIDLFEQKGIEYNPEIQNGDSEQVIPQKANSGDFITVVSPLGRPLIRRWLTGRSIRPLMEKIKVPILYVPEARLPLKKMLISIGGLGYEVAAENLAFEVAVASQADVTILHVITPTDVAYPGTRDMREHLNDLEDTNTLVGRSLRTALDIAQKAGLNAKATTRQGNVVDEILAEIRRGSYDMVCMGSPYSATGLRQLYTPNVTAEIAEAAHCPVLTARYKRE